MFSYAPRRKLVIAAFVVQNQIRGVMPDDPLLHIGDRELANQLTAHIHDTVETHLTRAEDGREGKRIQTEIMNAMWADFSVGRQLNVGKC